MKIGGKVEEVNKIGSLKDKWSREVILEVLPEFLEESWNYALS